MAALARLCPAVPLMKSRPATSWCCSNWPVRCSGIAACIACPVGERHLPRHCAVDCARLRDRDDSLEKLRIAPLTLLVLARQRDSGMGGAGSFLWVNGGRI